jgi:hypothetical protein
MEAITTETRTEAIALTALLDHLLYRFHDQPGLEKVDGMPAGFGDDLFSSP